MPRARSGPSPSQMYDGRKTPNRPTSLIGWHPHLGTAAHRLDLGSASPPAVVGIALGEEGIGALDHVLAGEDALRGVQLGRQARVEVQVGGDDR